MTIVTQTYEVTHTESRDMVVCDCQPCDKQVPMVEWQTRVPHGWLRLDIGPMRNSALHFCGVIHLDKWIHARMGTVTDDDMNQAPTGDRLDELVKRIRSSGGMTGRLEDDM